MEVTDIKIGRYDPDLNPDLDYGGWVEDENQTWILFLDREGRPSQYYAQRDEQGGVTSEPVLL